MINQKLGRLYSQFDPHKRFIYCGVVDEKKYVASSPKLVFLVKEANTRHSNWSIPALMRNEVGRVRRGDKPSMTVWKTWKQAGVWSYAIRNGFARFEDLNSVGTAAEGVSYIGMTNLKKTMGAGTSHAPTIKKHAKDYLDLWTAEIEVMKPDLILCGGTFKFIKPLLGLQTHNTRVGAQYAMWTMDGHPMLVIDWYHPLLKGIKHKEVYDELRKTLLELRRKDVWLLGGDL